MVGRPLLGGSEHGKGKLVIKNTYVLREWVYQFLNAVGNSDSRSPELCAGHWGTGGYDIDSNEWRRVDAFVVADSAQERVTCKGGTSPENELTAW